MTNKFHCSRIYGMVSDYNENVRRQKVETKLTIINR